MTRVDLELLRELSEAGMLVRARARRLLAEQPHLAGEDPRVLYSRMVAPETAPDFESCLRRAAFGLLLVMAKDRAEMADPTTGNAA